VSRVEADTLAVSEEKNAWLAPAFGNVPDQLGFASLGSDVPHGSPSTASTKPGVATARVTFGVAEIFGVTSIATMFRLVKTVMPPRFAGLGISKAEKTHALSPCEQPPRRLDDFGR